MQSGGRVAGDSTPNRDAGSLRVDAALESRTRGQEGVEALDVALMVDVPDVRSVVYVRRSVGLVVGGGRVRNLVQYLSRDQRFEVDEVVPCVDEVGVASLASVSASLGSS